MSVERTFNELAVDFLGSTPAFWRSHDDNGPLPETVSSRCVHNVSVRCLRAAS